MSTYVLIVEDEIAIQDLLSFNIVQAGFEPLLAASVEAAWQQIRQQLPQLIILDWMLPGGSGVMLAQQLRADARTCQIPIIMLTAKGDEQDKIQGLEAGADDYLTKPFSPRELMARIRAMLRRYGAISVDDAVVIGSLSLSPSSHRVLVGDVLLELGPTEFRLLHFLMTHPERVYTRTQLLDQVWGTERFVEERTVDVHVRRLRASLEAVGLDQLIQTVRGRGYQLVPQF